MQSLKITILKVEQTIQAYPQFTKKAINKKVNKIHQTNSLEQDEIQSK